MTRKPPEPRHDDQEKKTGIGMQPSIKKILLDERARRRRETGASWSIGALVKELVLNRYGQNGHVKNGAKLETPETDDD